MDFTRRVRKEIKPIIQSDSLDIYTHDVQLYSVPPTNDLQLQEFEDLALERLKVLRILEQANVKNLRLYSKEWKDSIISELNKEGLKNYVRLLNGSGTGTTEADIQARRRDYISHFILRLAYCRSKDLQRWFLSREQELFKIRFLNLNNEGIKQFLKNNHLLYSPISEEEKSKVKDGLYESTLGLSVAQIETQDFYEVPFTEVFDLVRSRRVFLARGSAYVPTNEFVSVISSKHQMIITAGLEAATRILPELEEDERLVHLLKGLHTSYTGKDYTLTKSACVPIESIDQLSKKSFPLCMRNVHEILRSKHHLKYFGRMQYGLFLKAIGVSLEDALRFWREEFTKIVDIEKFDKQYSYNIRHNYGKEGSMVNYTPYSCMKIITTNVGPGDTHGCPFKIYDTPNLKQKMINYGISVHHASEIASYAHKGHYQVACSKYFEISHNVSYERGINHPNQYFEESQYVIGSRQRPNKPKSKDSRLEDTLVTQLLSQDKWDEELWNATENQVAEKRSAEPEKEDGKPGDELESKKSKDEWDEDFDISMVEEF